jgi:hypothetical protein
MYDTVLKNQCMNDGAGVLEQYRFNINREAKSVSIVIAIVLVLRLMGWAAMHWKRRMSQLLIRNRS